MNGGIYLLQNDGRLIEMSEQAYDSEDLLQELLAKYPPPDWGPQRLQVIQQKNLAKVSMSAAERDFVSNIELWMLAYNYRKGQEKSEEGPGGT